MTDPEICIAALTDWPVEARPNGLVPNLGQAGFCLAPSGCQRIPDDHAIALFRDSGLGWLLTRNPHVELSDVGLCISPRFGVLAHRSADREYGTTLLSAIDAAIRTIAKENDHA